MIKESIKRRMFPLFMTVCVFISLTFPAAYGADGADEATIQQLKEKLIIANKVLDYEKLSTPFGHISVRVPGTETFMITRAVAPGMAKMDDIVVCDMNGKVIQGKYTSTYSEVVIHSSVYKKRKELNSVIHSHSDYVIALSMTGNTVELANLSASVMGPEPIALYKKMLFIDKPGLGEEVCDLLGPNKAVILKGHGALAVGRSIEEAIFVARELERAAMYQWMARAIGKIHPVTGQEKEELLEFQKKADMKGHTALRAWEYYEFILKK